MSGQWSILTSAGINHKMQCTGEKLHLLPSSILLYPGVCVIMKQLWRLGRTSFKKQKGEQISGVYSSNIIEQ